MVVDGSAGLAASIDTAAGKAAAELGKPDASWVKVAEEGKSFKLSSSTAVQYGANSSWLTKQLSGTVVCNNATFGRDPIEYVAKACYAQTPSAPSAPPAPAAPAAPVAGSSLAQEGGSFTVPAATLVKYGADSRWITRSVTGTAACTNAFFGGDPAFMTAKTCVSAGAAPVSGAAPAPAPVAGVAPTPSPAPSSSPITGDVIDSSGAIVASAYDSIAYRFGQAEGVAYRFGPAATKTGVETLPQRGDVGAISHGANNDLYYQLGAENNAAANLYVSIHGAAIGTPASGSSLSTSLGWFQSQATDRVTFMQRPQLLWQDKRLLPTAIDDYYRAGVLSPNDPADLPIVEDRGENAADSPSTRLSLVATQGSPTKPATIFTVGTYTAQNRASVKLAVGKVPTAISVTGGGEFAFVTVWDTVNRKGQVAVVSLGGSCERCTLDGAKYDWWHDWMDMVHPGFFNQGNYIFMKVLGYVDLPSNMKAPTSIKVTTGIHPYAAVVYAPNGALSGMAKEASPMANNRARLLPGGDYFEKYAKGGIAVIASKSEKTVAFMDLGPLFKYTNDMYLGSAASNLETQKVGLAANQWPYLLADRPQAAPTVIKTVTLADKPTSVLTTSTYNHWSKDDRRRMAPPNDMYWESNPHYARAWVATEGGKLHIFSLGAYVQGAKPAVGTPAEIAEVGAVTGLGNNITHLAAAKDYPDDADPINTMLIFTDRANRKWGWVKFAADGNSGKVLRTMEDSRVDPIMVTMSDNYSTKGNIVSVANYSGQSIDNYRFGDLVYPDRNFCWQVGVCPTMTLRGEYAGKLALPFKPFAVHASNVP
ncbi:hypothetical protein [Variovorax sp. KK3]|uniref:hypothetical protein n=1 Tax=Variovorax sp. KK3 TaxID=1855728 RepID=UPI00117D6E15|nr:hypothetical protein [Variovorax sp. KK3]